MDRAKLAIAASAVMSFVSLLKHNGNTILIDCAQPQPRMRDTALQKAGSGKESCQLNASGTRLKSARKAENVHKEILDQLSSEKKQVRCPAVLQGTIAPTWTTRRHHPRREAAPTLRPDIIERGLPIPPARTKRGHI